MRLSRTFALQTERREAMMGPGNRRRWLWLACALLAAGLVWGANAWADPVVVELTIKEHRFEPAELVVPAGQMIKLVIHNLDPTPEEFESHALNREKVIAGGATVAVFLSALQPGSYEFVGEFHEATAKGKIVAK
jgi:plastocyanin